MCWMNKITILFHESVSGPKAILFFFCLLSNTFSDFGSVGRKNKKIKLEMESGTRRSGTSA